MWTGQKSSFMTNFTFHKRFPKNKPATTILFVAKLLFKFHDKNPPKYLQVGLGDQREGGAEDVVTWRQFDVGGATSHLDVQGRDVDPVREAGDIHGHVDGVLGVGEDVVKISNQ